ncbi:uncharacterized protein LOC144702054 [Wolffia australiana]
MASDYSPEELIGTLEVHVLRARDVHNICIYQKQDVYVKICLTSNRGASIASRIVHGAGRDPEFDEWLCLDVRSLESSLNCEIWMHSRVKNYLEDQLLGFTLVPLLQIFRNGGKLSGEFSLSSTDLGHSPAGFVELAISLTGCSAGLASLQHQPVTSNSEVTVDDGGSAIQNEYQRIEFPDPDMAEENAWMVSEFFGIPHEEVEHKKGVLAIVATDCGSSCGSIDHSASGSLTESMATAGSSDPEVDSGAKPVAVIRIEAVAEAGVVQQEIVDMYMKSMQQFTESLAKMKLPMDLTENIEDEGKVKAEEKTSSTNGAASRVFYGSRAFF